MDIKTLKKFTNNNSEFKIFVKFIANLRPYNLTYFYATKFWEKAVVNFFLKPLCHETLCLPALNREIFFKEVEELSLALFLLPTLYRAKRVLPSFIGLLKKGAERWELNKKMASSFQERNEFDNERMDHRIKTICEDLKQLDVYMEKKKLPSKTRRPITQAIWCFEDLSQYLRLDELSDLDGTVRDNALEDTLEGDSEDQSILDESEVAVPNSRQKEMASSDHFERMNPSEIAKLRFNKKSSSFKKSQTESSKVKDVHAPEYVTADQLHDQYQHPCGKEQQEPHQSRNKTPAKKVKAYESVSEPVGQHHYRHQHHDRQEQQEQQLPRNKTPAKKVKTHESVSEQVDQPHYRQQHHDQQEQQEQQLPRNKTPAKKVKPHESVSEQVGQLCNQCQHHYRQEQQEPHQPRNKTTAKEVKAYESVPEQVDQLHNQPEQQEQQFPRNKTPAKKNEDKLVEADKDKSAKKEEENMATRDLLRDAISKNMKFFLEGNTLKVRSQDSAEKLTTKDSSKPTPTVRFKTNHNDERVSRK